MIVTTALAVAPQRAVPDINGTYEQQLAAVASLPRDIRDFIDRRANCNHWLGEEPYDAERRAEIQFALMALSCADLSKDENSLKSRYSRSEPVLKALIISKDWSPG